MLYMGIVEDNVDPLKLNRCKVRIFGKHTEDRSIYPTEDLPWSQCISINSNIDGESSVNIPNNGDCVIISFLDPEEQKGVLLGSIPKIAQELPDFNIGFSDPNSEHPSSEYIGESPISRLARNENISNTIIQDKKDDVKTGVSCVNESFDEPETAYAAEYPYNKVIQTKHHVIELDDTSGAERVHIYHKSGSFIENHPDGTQVEKVKAKKILIVESDDNNFIGGNFNVHVDGDKNQEIVGDKTEKMSGLNMEITGAGEIQITGTANITVNGILNIQGNGAVNISGSPLNLN